MNFGYWLSACIVSQSSNGDKCSSCGHWNRVSVNKIFLEQTSPEPKVKVLIPICEEVFYLALLR
jgi:hypothetical protein